MFKFLLILSLISCAQLSAARTVKGHAKSKKKAKKTSQKTLKKSTAVSICTRGLKVQNKSFVENRDFTQAVIVAIETDSEEKCKITGKSRADQYSREGWKCMGLKNEELFSCVKQSASSFAIRKGVTLDHLLFTNLNKHHALIAYINPNSHETCMEDKKDIESGGVTDARCYDGENRK